MAVGLCQHMGAMGGIVCWHLCFLKLQVLVVSSAKTVSEYDGPTG